jgi:hypothetical protein
MLVIISGLAIQDMGPRSTAPRLSLVEDLNSQMVQIFLAENSRTISLKSINSWTVPQNYHD